MLVSCWRLGGKNVDGLAPVWRRSGPVDNGASLQLAPSVALQLRPQSTLGEAPRQRRDVTSALLSFRAPARAVTS